MEEYNDLEQATGSPTAGESGFVHVEPIDSASTDGSSTNQDDGVVVTTVDTTEDGGNEEFVDCPDDLVESREADLVPEDNQHILYDNEREILPHHYQVLLQEERRQLMTELTNLRHQLKDLVKKHTLIGGNDGGFTDEVTSALPLHEVINDCSRVLELALSEQSQTDGTIKELYATLNMKSKEIEDLNMKVIEVSSVEPIADRILSLIATVLGEEEFQDASVSHKLSHLEKRSSILIENYNRFLFQVQMLNQCLTEGKSDYHMQIDLDKVLFSVRDELLELKRKELELVYKNSYIEDEYRKLMEQLHKGRETIEMLNSEIGKLNGEVEVQKTRCNNTKEKLNLAVTKGKSLVQQRDSLKQAIVEKTNELDKCLVDLQEKSSALEAAELRKEEMESQVSWLLESLNMAKLESINLQDEINTTKEVARAKIDRLTVSLLAEAQEKNYLLEEFSDLTHKYEELHVLKDKNGSLQIDLQRSEDKNAILREKLSMAVKKGKGLVQERESLKQKMAEKNGHIESLKLELEQQEAINSEYRDQINKLSNDVGRIEKLESDLLCSKEERDQIGQFLVESNTMLQHVIEATDDIILPVDLAEPVEKVKWCVTTMKSLQDALSISEKQIFKLNEEKRELESIKLRIEEDTKNLENEIKKLREEASYHEHKFMDASSTIKTLEDAFLKSENTISDLVREKKNAEQEISTLNTQLACKNENWSSELSSFLDNLQVLLKDETLLTLVKQSFEKKIENFMEMDRHLKDIKDYFDLEQLQDYPADIEKSYQLSTLVPAGYDNTVDAKDVGSYAEKTLEKLNLRNQILADGFDHFSSFIDELTASLLKKLEAIRNSMPFMIEQTKTLQQNVNNLQIDKQAQENRAVMLGHHIKVLLSACADVTKEMKFLVENNILEIDSAHGLEKLIHNPSSDVRAVDDVAVADIKISEEMLSATTNVQSVIEHFVGVKQNLSSTIKEFQAELEKTRSMYEKVKEENNIFQNRVFKLETKLKASKNLCDEMGIKLEDNKAKEDEWNKREAELSEQITTFMNDHDAKNDLLSASEVNSLFNKINGITVPFPNIGEGDINDLDSDPIKKIFYIVDNVNELVDQITLLSHSKEELHSTLSKQALEIEHLKEEFEEAVNDQKDFEKTKKELFELSTGIERIIKEFGGDESVGDKNSADVAGLLPVLERLVQGIVLDNENSKVKAEDLGFKLLETHKVAEELASKVKLLEDLNKNQTGLPDRIYEKGVADASSLPPRSEISEVEDPGSVGKRATTSAAHVRTLRKGSNDHLALNIDPESDHLIDTQETVVDKGHIFKSLHTSGVVPTQGKIIADRLDGIWVSGSRALMSQPRARLGLIAYWIVLHLWLLGTLL